MYGVQAWEILHDPERGGRLNMDDFRRMLIRAGYSMEEVRKASLQRGWDRLNAGEVM